MEWIELKEGQKVPTGNYIYTIRRASPYTLNHNNGNPEYFVARYGCNLEMFESVIAYAEVEPFIPKDEDMDKNEKLYSYQDIENAIKDFLDKIFEIDMSDMDWEYTKKQAYEILKRFNH